MARTDLQLIVSLPVDAIPMIAPDATRRMLVPSLGDWAQAARVLGGLAEKYGYEQIGRARLTNDALIATSAGRAGIASITVNRRGFGRLAEF
jgi:hypothetical protein